jgi:nicotinate-nucleotide adenylyltransferase
MVQQRIGIYAGTFNPVHAGHIAFALQAMERGRLDRLYFLPERRPRHKKGVEHFGHRVAMLKKAALPHPKFKVLELDDVSFTVVRTLPKLRAQFPADQLVFLFGSDAIGDLPTWPQAERLLRQVELVIGCRNQDDAASTRAVITGWPLEPRSYMIFDSYAPDVSSGRVRAALQRRQSVRGLLKSVEHYSNHNWLYISLAEAAGIDKP